MHQRPVLPFRGTSAVWRNKLTGIIQGAGRGCDRKAALGIRAGSVGPGKPVEHEPAVYPRSKGRQQYPGLHWEENCQQVKGGDPFLLL